MSLEIFVYAFLRHMRFATDILIEEYLYIEKITFVKLNEHKLQQTKL